MFFDATGSQDGSVVEAVEQLLQLLRPHRGERRPEEADARRMVVLHWGSISSFPAFVTSVSAKYTLFNGRGPADPGAGQRGHGGDARRAVPAEPDLGQRTTYAGCTGRVAGDTLASVAYAEYGDPTQWRALAAYNGIDDPLRVRTGTTLLLPSSEELVAAR